MRKPVMQTGSSFSSPVSRLFVALFLIACGSERSTATAEEAPEQPAEAAGAEAMVEPAARAEAAEPAPETPEPEAGPPSSEGWNSVVATYVTDDGGFRYAALREHDEHKALLASYVAEIGAASDDEWERDAALAFYINAYNALTVSSVLELWPVESVMQEDGFFDGRKHMVAGAEMTLNDLENTIIRGERFAEPRIHFAVNCASVGCPPLQNEAFTAANLEAKLAAATQAFVRASTRFGRRDVQLSQIFEWFAGDFEAVGGVRSFVAAQLEGEEAERVANERTRIRHFDYDWDLNGRE
ncbi:MAG: DUF547 domain-containing protein [Myxococcota bacterium]